MESIDKLCCCCGQEESFNNCLICGKPLIYSGKTVMRRCAVCGEEKPSDAVCEDGHFVCDECHNKDGAAVRARLLNTDEKDPIKIFLDVVKLPPVHMHGPEHHCIVPCVLLTAYKITAGISTCANVWTRHGSAARNSREVHAVSSACAARRREPVSMQASFPRLPRLRRRSGMCRRE